MHGSALLLVMSMSASVTVAPAAWALSRDVAAEGVAGFYTQPSLHGDQMVFISEGDLWRARLSEELSAPLLATRLTSTAEIESHPVISPHGGQVAFASQREGNIDVYVMPLDGGPATRLTWHQGADIPVAWSLDGSAILFTSARRSPLGRPELWSVPAEGGQPIALGFGECSMAAPTTVPSGGERLIFTRWSNENWNWRGYRGGTAPDLWVGHLAAGRFWPLVEDSSNDLFPMPLAGRVYFASDRDGLMNIWSVDIDGEDLRQHTRFATVPGRPTAIEGYEVRWPRADADAGGRRIAFAQGADLALLDTTTDAVTRLTIGLASDRAATQPRFVDPMPTLTEFALTPDGSRVILGSRGELATVPAGEPKAGSSAAALQITRSARARDWGATSWQKPAPKRSATKTPSDPAAAPQAEGAADTIDARTTVLFITDADGEQQLAELPVDGSAPATLLTTDRSAWLLPPQVSHDGRWIAFADKTQALFLLDRSTGQRREVDRSDGWEIVEYRFSPDGRYLAYAKPLPTGFRSVLIHDLERNVNIPVSDDVSNDDEPRWDPAGRYLYVLSKRHFDPILSEIDFEHAFVRMTEVHAFPLESSTPPPSRGLAHGTGFDLKAWTAGGGDEGEAGGTREEADRNGAPPPGESAGRPRAVRIDSDGLGARRFVLPIEPGNYSQLEAIRGGVLFLGRPTVGIADQPWPQPPLGVPNATLHRWRALGGKPEGHAEDLLEAISTFAISADASTIAWLAGRSIQVRPVGMAPGGKDEEGEGNRFAIDAATLRIQIDPPEEWRQILDETWRLQRDFFWDPTLRGVDWNAVRERYAALLPRVGTRRELAQLQGMLVGELGTSHTYVSPGATPIPGVDPVPIPVGALGADVALDGQGHRILSILPDDPWDRENRSPLAAPWLGIKEGQYILAIDGRSLGARTNLDELLMDRAGRVVRVTIADDAFGRGARTVEVRTLESEQPLRYAAWVGANRRRVAEESNGTLGYLHIPDMDSQGLIAFSRLFYPQLDRRGMVIDIRDNGGGYVSQMIIQRLARRVWAFQKPRHGAPEKYPQRTLHGHVVILIDQHAGSDGDIFPESIRILGIGPLIGTRTWGGVVGIRGDKPAMDAGLTTQPEFAWWEPKRGWSLENSGVAPDIEVSITPEDRLAGRDPQLARAIAELLRMVKDDPRPLPAPPGGW
jgi:tricorn protease